MTINFLIKFFSLLAICFFSLSAFASEKADNQAIKTCLRKWGTNPFTAPKDGVPKFRIMKAGVKIGPIGKEPSDDTKTKEPELILVKHSVSIAGNQTVRLMNPNGWYCLQANVAIIGKSSIVADCSAKVETGRDDVSVAGSGDTGVAVGAKISLDRVNCKK